MYFEVTTFDLPSLSRMTPALLQIGHPLADQIASYPTWANEFGRNLYAWYHHQFNRHVEMTRMSFERRHGHYSSDDHPDWRDWLRYSGVDRHREIKDEREHALTTWLEKVTGHMPDEPRIYTMAELANIVADEEQLPVRREEFNRAWFDQEIHTTPRDQESLRQCPYPAYLGTTHWRHVRCALMMIRHARCQAAECDVFGESFYGDEDKLHVHHKSYANLGCERYDDLSLLCDRHHKEHHESIDGGGPGVEMAPLQEPPLFSLLIPPDPGPDG